jgi:hypothetical protein
MKTLSNVSHNSSLISSHVRRVSITMLFVTIIAVLTAAQPTISPALGFGSFKHYTNSKSSPVAMLNINAGYQFLKEKNIKPVTELSVNIPLLNNNHPISFALQPGIQFNLTERIAITAAAGPEMHIQQLYKYPIDAKDTQQSIERHRWQPSAKLRIQQQFQEDANTHLYIEIAYDQRMPLIKFGMHIIITKK